jgi:hypothetical protein
MLLIRCAGALVVLRVVLGAAVLLFALLLVLLALLVVLSAQAAALHAMANVAASATLQMRATARPPNKPAQLPR